MPLESPPMNYCHDHPQLDEFLGFSYAASPDLSLRDPNSHRSSSQTDFLGFSYVAINDNYLHSRNNDQESFKDSHKNDEFTDASGNISSDGEYLDANTDIKTLVD